jgi:hypothetical protein
MDPWLIKIGPAFRDGGDHVSDWFEEAKRLREQGLTYKQIGQKLGKTEGWVRDRFYRERKTAKIVQKTAAELVAEAKEQAQRQHEQKLLQELIRDQAARDLIADKMIAAIKALPELDIKPIEFNPSKKYSPEEVVLQMSDIQAGTYISREATGGLNEYNRDILKKQFRELTRAMFSIISRQKQLAPIPTLNVHMLGDMVEGMGIYVGQAQHTDQDLYYQLFTLAESICEFLIQMLSLFDNIRIVAIGGNHGRVVKKGENPHWVNWDVYLYKYCEARLQNYKRISWTIPLSWWYLDTIRGWKFLLLHGDDIKSWNGIPYYGIDRADAKWTKLLNSKGMRYDYLELGHFHSPSELSSVTGEIIINGCWPGGSLFALKSLMTSSRPRQNLFAVHPERGKTWAYPIWLD